MSGVARLPAPKSAVAFADEIADPDNHPFPTPIRQDRDLLDPPGREAEPHGLGEFRQSRPGLIPSRAAPTRAAAHYPLQMVTPKSKARTHSTHGNQPMLYKLDPAGRLDPP